MKFVDFWRECKLLTRSYVQNDGNSCVYLLLSNALRGTVWLKIRGGMFSAAREKKLL